MPRSNIAAYMQAFPHELFHYHIIPELLSDYVHNLLVNSEHPDWNPFSTLCLVSHAFHESCLTLYRNIFGPKGYDEFILQACQSDWEQANRDPTRAMPVEDYVTEEDLTSNGGGLIQVYACAAISKSYLNLDVLWHLELERKRVAGELDDADDDDIDERFRDVAPGTLRTRRFKMRDDCMHRAFLPLTCAIKLCDQIQPERLAYIAADYLAGIIPFFTTAPLILKNTQDLEMYASGEHKLDVEILLDWIPQTLHLIEHIEEQLEEVQDIGRLVKLFKRPLLVPYCVLEKTKILQALDKVVAGDWREGSPSINDHARTVKMRLQSIQG